MIRTMDGMIYARMIRAGAASLRTHVREINDLNVFPIPDGDTGENMLLTMMGGVQVEDMADLGAVAAAVADGMLLSARGNSGVILSQFFEGMAIGLRGLSVAEVKEIGEAFRCGVRQAYQAVMTPTEGTILTVAREATEAACNAEQAETLEEYLEQFLVEGNCSLKRTPELLPVLKKAGVVDSGAAGLLCIIQGMLCALRGENVGPLADAEKMMQEPNPEAFTEDSVLEYGYCTELLLRLQWSKVDLDQFDPAVITNALQTLGDSIVAVRSGSMVKLHVHTMTPDRVLAICQQYGEFLKVKIENMSLQHNNTVVTQPLVWGSSLRERKKYGVVAVASGEGLKNTFKACGADAVVDGGQSMNPCTEDFIAAFDAVNAETIFVFPNNGNIILTVKQAANLYHNADVRVIESTTIGAGYVSLSMLNTDLGDADAIVADLIEAMHGVVTAEISHCVRDATMEEVEMHTGDYIGFVGKELLAVHPDRFEAVCLTLNRMKLVQYDICIFICGSDATEEEVERIWGYMRREYPDKEVYIINGEQEVYDYIIIAE